MTTTEMFRGHGEVVAGKWIIGVNVAVWVLMAVLSADPSSAAGPLFERGALFGPLVASGEWWRLITGAFLHAGLM
ncbi:MAG: rhomboid family intramembrane serine protease, partial [Actinomycetes bacterium]